MKDQTARDRLESQNNWVSDISKQACQTERKLKDFKDETRDTLLNLSARVRDLEVRLAKKCKTCGQITEELPKV